MSTSKSIGASVAMLGILVTTATNAQKRYDPGASDTEIRIGQTAPYSGPASALSGIGKVEQAYFRMVNDQGGINGRKIVLISNDDGYSPPKTVEQTRKLVEGDEVLAMFQGAGTPTQAAVQKYLNDKKIPQLLVSSGASRFTDPKNAPWTTALNPNYQSEGGVYARFVEKNYPNAKVAVLMQNDDFGKDYLKGFKDALGTKASRMIVAEATYEAGEPTVDSQIVKLANSGADVFLDISTAKFTAQAIKKGAELNWKAVHIITVNSTPVRQVLVPAGLENARGVVSVNYMKDPLDPQWANDDGLNRYRAFMSKYAPELDASSGLSTYGYLAGQVLAKILSMCGDEITRANIMKQTTGLKEFVSDVALPGMSISTAPDDYRINKQFQFARFNGERWELFGPIVTDDE